jgi:hypothetical protein
VFSRHNFRSVPDLNLQPNHSPCSSPRRPNQPNLSPCSSPRRPNHGGSFLSRDAVNSNRPRLIQIVWRWVGLIFFRVQMRCLCETGIQSPSPLRGPVALAIYPTFTLGPTAVQVQGVLPAFGWDM